MGNKKHLLLLLITIFTVEIYAQDDSKEIDCDNIRNLIIAPLLKVDNSVIAIVNRGNTQSIFPNPKKELSFKYVKLKRAFITDDGLMIIKSEISEFHHVNILTIAIVDKTKDRYRTSIDSLYSFYNPKWKEIENVLFHTSTIHKAFNVTSGFQYSFKNETQESFRTICFPEQYMPHNTKRIIRNISCLISTASLGTSFICLGVSNYKFERYKNQSHLEVDRLKSEELRKQYYTTLGIGVLFIIPIVITISI